MDLNHIKLPATVINELYKTVLVEPVQNTGMKEAPAPAEKPVITSAEATTPEWKSLGSNEKNILIVVSNSDAVYLPDNDLNFLTGVLGACKLSLADVAVVNRFHYPEAGYKELIAYFKSRVILLLGVEPAAMGLPINFPHYQLQAFQNNTFLFTPPLEEIEKDKLEKSKLWVSLKRLFNV
ncbi:MAG TPA: hypothetical protein PK977_06425 [Chitinophagaceae bacterium]|nr:hypothetical protein [Chitinophagaceae bacterium]